MVSCQLPHCGVPGDTRDVAKAVLMMCGVVQNTRIPDLHIV